MTTLTKCLLCLALALGACAYPERTRELTTLRPPECSLPQGSTPEQQDPDRATLVVVVASGGGTRAASLTLGTLEAMGDVPWPTDTHPTATLLDHIDVISSVSGGSLAAAHFARFGKAGFPQLAQFLADKTVGGFIWDFVNPVNALLTPLPGRAQIDNLIEVFAQEAGFGQDTYADLTPRPYLVLNAADMAEGTVFPFTQATFDLICSDLAQMPLAEAIAGSAAFPFAFGSLPLRNYARPLDGTMCAAHKAGLTQHDPQCDGEPLRWPPASLAPVPSDADVAAAADPQTATSADKSYAIVAEAVLRAVERSYCGPGCRAPQEVNAIAQQKKNWIHLLDGGIADNLGITVPIRMLLRRDHEPTFFLDLASGRITRIIFVIINARSDPESQVGDSGAPPGPITQMLAITGASIDAASRHLLGRLEALLKQELAAEIERCNADKECSVRLLMRHLLSHPSELSRKLDLLRGSQAALDIQMAEARETLQELQSSLVPIDFDFAPESCEDLGQPDACTRAEQAGLKPQDFVHLRTALKQLPTTWWLDETCIDMLRAVPACFIKSAAMTLGKDGAPDPLATGAAALQCDFVELAARMKRKLTNGGGAEDYCIGSGPGSFAPAR